jgi:hypothetical protein
MERLTRADLRVELADQCRAADPLEPEVARWFCLGPPRCCLSHGQDRASYFCPSRRGSLTIKITKSSPSAHPE